MKNHNQQQQVQQKVTKTDLKQPTKNKKNKHKVLYTASVAGAQKDTDGKQNFTQVKQRSRKNLSAT